jgi:hypothetical protein
MRRGASSDWQHNLPLCRAYLQKNYFQPADLKKWVRFRWGEAAANQAIEVSRSRTNNPVESHFNALKAMLGRLCRRRLDSLVWTLVSEVVPRYALIAAAALVQQKNGTAPPDPDVRKVILQKVVSDVSYFSPEKSPRRTSRTSTAAMWWAPTRASIRCTTWCCGASRALVRTRALCCVRICTRRSSMTACCSSARTRIGRSTWSRTAAVLSSGLTRSVRCRVLYDANSSPSVGFVR